MTYQEREEIFAKDVLTTQDLAALLRMDISTASETMQHMKRQIGKENLRLDIKGKLHTQDYLDFFRITSNNLRYAKRL